MVAQFLVLMVIAAAAAWAAAALFAALRVRGEIGWVVGLVAGVLAGARATYGTWPFPPVGAVEWVPYLALAGMMVHAGVLFVLPRWWARAAAVGIAVGGLAAGLALARLLGPVEPAGARWAWRIGIPIGMGALAAAGAAGFARVDGYQRNQYRATAALAAVLVLGAPAVLFASSSSALMKLELALAGAWVGTVLAAITKRDSPPLGGAGTMAAAMYAFIWLTAWFTGDGASAWALGLGLAAVGVVAFGTTSRRESLGRFVLAAGVAGGLVLGSAAVSAPRFLKAAREMGVEWAW